MRPGRRAEGNRKACLFLQARREPVGGADDEHRRGLVLPPPVAQPPANAALLMLSPPASKITLIAPSGMRLATAIDSSSMRRAASSARLSLISTISTALKPALRPASAARLR